MIAVAATVCSSVKKKKKVDVGMEVEIIEWDWRVSWQVLFCPLPILSFFLLGEEEYNG